MSQDHSKKKPVDPEIVRADMPHPDEVIHVPKGTNKARFLMTFLLVVLVLTTFTVTGPLLDVLGGRDKSFNKAMSWTTADGEARSISAKKFQEDKRQFLLVAEIMSGSRSRDITDEQVASFLVLDDAADKAGIRTPESEVAKMITARFPSREAYDQTLRRNRTTNKDVETMLRRMLRMNRYMDLQSQALSVPDPATVEASWKGRHQEYAFDYTAQPVAALVDEARKSAPKGDELKAWFDARPDAEKEAYKTKPEVSAELVAFTLEGPWDPSAILAKYPRPADENEKPVPPHLSAETYAGGGGFGYIRFPKPPTTRGDTNYKPYEEVKDQAAREAPLYNALMDWAADLKKREAAGETIDLAKEASALGLSYRKQGESHNRDDWKGLIDFVGRITLDRLFDPETKPNKLFDAIQVDEKAFVYGRVLESKPARMPEFAEIETRVSDAWAEQKARELAVAKLDAIRDSFGKPSDPKDPTAAPVVPESDQEHFKTAVQAAGLTVQHRDWQERTSPPQPDESPGDLYIRQTPALYAQKVNTIVKPALDREGTTAYLVRVDGVRDPPLSKIKPEEIAQIAKQQASQDRMMLNYKLTSREYLQARYGLDLASWHAENKQPTE